ncbi:MAG: sugar transferase [Verrucomicrobiota bacterium]
MYLPGTTDLTKDAQSVPNPQSARPKRDDVTLDGRRILDIVLSALALIFLAPMMLAVAAAIKLQDGGPVFFAQERIGLGGSVFKCLKFRSMVVDAEARLNHVLETNPELKGYWESHRKLLWDPRVTLLGQIIRKTSLDELPQLINVLRGDMSLVGPRPIMVNEKEIYGRWLERYCTMRPGITCLWQIRGRNQLTFRQRIALDMLYRRNENVGSYLGILVQTVPAVLLRQGTF